MKLKLTDINKALITVGITFSLYVLVTIFKDIYLVYLLGPYLYIILGFLVPAIVHKSNIMIKGFDKNSVTLNYVITLGVAGSLLIEIIAYYLTPSYYQAISNDILFATFFPLNIIIEFATVVILFMYFTKICEFLQTELKSVYTYIFCVGIYVMLTDLPIKSSMTAIIIFYVLFYLKNENYTLLFMMINMIISIFFRYICYTYMNFGIEHYFIFLAIILSFYLFEKAFKYAERMMLRREFVNITFEKPGKVEYKVFWILIVFVGISLVIYGG